MDVKQIIKDLYNSYNSKLSEELTPKMGKIFNAFKIAELKAKVEVLNELLNKI